MSLHRPLLRLLPLGLLASTAAAELPSVGVMAWVRTEVRAEDFPLVAANKDWASGALVDTTSHHALGVTRTSGTLSGWALALQPNGAWCWNAGDGKARLDYVPTAERQPLNDGAWHLLAFTLDPGREEARLFYDGEQVAVYSLTGMGTIDAGEVTSGTEGFEVELALDPLLTAERVAAAWKERTGEELPSGLAAEPVEELRVLAWNIWHGGRRDGEAEGIARVVEAIRASGADVVCMQETYGSGARIADALGFQLYLRSTNLSVMSRYPIRETHPLYRPFRFGGVTLELSEDQRVRAFSLWIHNLPSWDHVRGDAPPTAGELVAADEETRGSEIRGILAALAEGVPDDGRPQFVAGDFNSPSHLDWSDATAARHAGLVVDWPVSRAMHDAGYTDAFRQVHPDPAALPARTWSPRFTDSMQDRIDYVYYRGDGVHATAARMIDQVEPRWPSDHAAVLATFRLGDG